MSKRKVTYEEPTHKLRPKLLLPNRVKQFEAGRIRPCAECAYCVPIDEVDGECRRLSPHPATIDGKGYSIPVVPIHNFFCGLFLNRDAALYAGERESAED